MPEPAVRILRSSAELQALAPRWRELWQSDPHATPFQSPDWLLPWWHHFGEAGNIGAEPRVVLLSSGDQLVGVLPFYLYPEPHGGERKLLLLGVGTSDYLDGVLAPACTREQVQAGIEHLLQSGGFSILTAGQLRAGSSLAQMLGEWNGPGLQQFATESCGRMSALTLGELPVKIRRNAMYYRNRAQRMGRLEYTLADETNWGEAFDHLQRLHTERWERRGEPGVLADPAVLAWHREALPRLAAAGTLRMGTLRLNDDVLGVLYSLIDLPDRPDRTQFFYLTAFSQAHADLRPGTLLLARAIEYAASEGVRTIDMLRGEEGYKELWHLERLETHGFSLPSPPTQS